jgi:hypothetical protein
MTVPKSALSFNGVNGSTGEYLLPELSAETLANAATGRKPDQTEELHAKNLDELRRWREEGHFGVTEQVDPNDLSEAGWGIILPNSFDPRILDALRPLLDHRKAQAAAELPLRYQEFTDFKGAYRPGETALDWAARQGIGPGPVNPDRGVPYYLLIVGSPEQIPYRFQYHLDVQHAVGRIHFDTYDEYRNYAESVVEAEQQGLRRPQRVALAAVANPGDRATSLSTQHLVQPLVNSLQTDARFAGWDIQHAPATTKQTMAELVGGARSAPLLFTASHGVGFDDDDPRQLAHQGALLCQDWPGRAAWGRKPIPPDHYLSADDITANSHVWGSIYFHFACFGAGTPQEDDFSHYRQLQEQLTTRVQIAPRPFVARLPQRLLGHPAGGALAMIGHVDRAWTWSFSWNSVRENTDAFIDLMKRLMQGQRVGFALETFNERYGQIAAMLSTELDDIRFGKRLDPLYVADLWTANNDARSYVIVGDPAAHLVFAPDAPPEPPYPSYRRPDAPSLPPPDGPSADPAPPYRPPDGPSADPAPPHRPPDGPSLPPADGPSVPPADFSILNFGRPAVASSGSEINTTFLYVHGTGTREKGFNQQVGDIRKGIKRYLPQATITVEECFWGVHGVDLTSIAAVLPPERSSAFDDTDDAAAVQEREAMLWAALYADPYAELHAFAQEARFDSGTDLRDAFARRLRAAPADPEVRRLLTESETAAEALETAVNTLLADRAYQWALGAATQGPDVYAAVLARATVALVVVQAQQAGNSSALARDPDLRLALTAAIADVLNPGGDFSPVGAIAGALAWPLMQIGTGWVNLDRTRATEGISPFPGDILRYLADGATIRNAVREHLVATQAPIILAHSLGGIICVDLLAQEQFPSVKLLITVGSQAPFLYQIGALPSRKLGEPLPDHFPPWLNIYHRNDLLSYVGKAVFGTRIWDREVRSFDPFPNAHGAYWFNRETWAHIAVALRDLGLTQA